MTHEIQVKVPRGDTMKILGICTCGWEADEPQVTYWLAKETVEQHIQNVTEKENRK